MKIKNINTTDTSVWDRYVYAHPNATLYHLAGWKNIIEKTYGHKTFYLMAVRDDNTVAGVLPLVHLKHFIFDNSLISIPFFDMGGILADDEDAEKALFTEAVRIGGEVKAETVELRHTTLLSSLSDTPDSLPHITRSHKVRMILELPESSEALIKSFKSKLRSQIRKPSKEGLEAKIGGLELLEAFYDIFLVNMRDLGSPVHSDRLMKHVLEEFPDIARIVLVHKDQEPMAASLVIGFKDILENPWASSLRQHSRLSPNMLLYWTMLDYACTSGYGCFDFGRSSPDEGTYKFKEQWGAAPHPLHWHYTSLTDSSLDTEPGEKSKFDTAIHYWKKLPVPVTRIMGPIIRKHIGL